MQRISIVFSALLLLITVGAAAGQPLDHVSAKGVPQLRVRGEAELQVPADQFELTVGVVTQAELPDPALDRNAARMQEVEEALRQAGLQQQEYRTGRFTIQPRWSSPPPKPSRDWEPRIIGYTVTNTITVQSTKLELAGPLIRDVVAAGANTIESLVFGLSDPRAHRQAAIQQATRHARADAEALAAAASVELKHVLRLELDQAAVRPLSVESTRFRMEAMEASAAPPPIAPGKITVRAGVSLTYVIAPASGRP